MHKALYVDEIIRGIFALASEDEQSILSVLARTCKCWTDPALEQLWLVLPSAAPLVELVTGISLINRIYVPTRRLLQTDLLRLGYYAPKVRQINLRRNIEVHSDIIMLFRQKFSDTLPALQHVKLSNNGLSPIALCLTRSQSLLNLEVDLGFTPNTRIPFPEHYLGAIIDAAPNLARLLVRGTLTSPLIKKIAGTKSLKSLSIRCGRSLTLEGFFDVLALPLLQELEVPLSHFDLAAFQGYLSLFCLKSALPHLTKLVLRSQACHAQLLLDTLPLEQLSSLSIELDDSFDAATTWNTLFASIRPALSLCSLNIQHFLDLGEIDGGPHSRDHEVTHHDLRNLTFLPLLQRLILDTTIPPAINDAQLKDLLKNWPRLESLDFGPGPDCLSDDESKAFESRSSLTLQALDVITTQAPNLAKLRLPIVDTGTQPQGPSFNGNTQASLTQLTLAGTSTLDSQMVVPYLRQTFPSLKILDGVSDHDNIPCS